MNHEKGVDAMDWSIQEVARLAGTTSRTLRHYDDVGLLAPSRIGANGYRYYDDVALRRLQRILLLRDLGLGIPAIAEVLAGHQDDGAALRIHLHWLQREKERLDRQIASVETTIEKLEGGEEMTAEQMLDGFDHTQYKDEVVERWGADTYAASDRWWRGMSADERAEWRSSTTALGRDWASAAERGVDSGSAEAQELARRHVAWLSGIPGTPGHPTGATREYVLGLAEMYVADERFAANYGGVEGAAFVRDALTRFVDANL